MIKSIFHILLFSIIFTSTLYSEMINEIKIDGNRRISDETVKVLGNLNINKVYDAADLNNSLKMLYDSDFFDDIKFNLTNNILEIKLIERPIIESIEIIGIKNSRLLEEIQNLMNLKNRMSFSETILAEDLDKIKNFLKSNGYYFSSIDTFVEKNNELNSININYKLELGDKAKISQINFIGDNSFKRKKLLEVIASEEHKFWKFISNKVYLNNYLIDLDKRLLSNFYKNEGYYNVKISEAYAEISNNQKFILTYSIDPGKKFYFAKPQLILPDDYDKNDFLEIYKIFDKIENENYSLSSFNDILDEIELIASSNLYDFIDAEVETNFLNDEKIEFTFNVINSNQNFVEKINVFGNFNTLEEVIRNKFIVDEGDPLNKILFNKTLNNLRSTGYFKNVTSEIVDGSDNSLKIINLKVEEQPTGEISLGAGFGTSGGTVGGGITEKNFLGKGISLNTNLEISEESLRGQFIYSKPNFAYTDNTLFTSLSSTSSDYLTNYGYKVSETSFSIGTKFEQYENLFFSPEIDLSFEDLETNNDATQALKKQEGTYQDFYFNYGLSYDKRNSSFKPTNGFLTTFNQTLPIVSENKEISNTFTSTKYHLLKKDTNLIGKASLYLKSVNTLTSDEDVRVSKRANIPYNRLRGFEKGKVGPIDNNDYVGGNYVGALNLSTNIPSLLIPADNIDFSYFIDFGNVWGVDYSDEIDNSNYIRSSTGLGVDLLTPIGPLSFSYTAPITKKNTDKTENFRFNIGTTF